MIFTFHYKYKSDNHDSILYQIQQQHLTILKTDSSGIKGDHNDIGACIMEDADKENSHQIRLMSQAQEDTAALHVERMLSLTCTAISNHCRRQRI
jgi:hypothetical protein